jgi:hypothetical protein
MQAFNTAGRFDLIGISGPGTQYNKLKSPDLPNEATGPRPVYLSVQEEPITQALSADIDGFQALARALHP